MTVHDLKDLINLTNADDVISGALVPVSEEHIAAILEAMKRSIDVRTTFRRAVDCRIENGPYPQPGLVHWS